MPLRSVSLVRIKAGDRELVAQGQPDRPTSRPLSKSVVRLGISPGRLRTRLPRSLPMTLSDEILLSIEA